MSRENVEAVSRLFAAFQSVDVGNFERRLDEVREIFDAEVEWVAAPHSLLASEEYRGGPPLASFRPTPGSERPSQAGATSATTPPRGAGAQRTPTG
jgi:hypothetical protein